MHASPFHFPSLLPFAPGAPAFTVSGDEHANVIVN